MRSKYQVQKKIYARNFYLSIFLSMLYTLLLFALLLLIVLVNSPYMDLIFWVFSCRKDMPFSIIKWFGIHLSEMSLENGHWNIINTVVRTVDPWKSDYNQALGVQT